MYCTGIRHCWPGAAASGTVMVTGTELWGVPDRDTTLDAFVTPDAETDGTEDGAETDQEADATEVGSEQAEPEQAEPDHAEDPPGDESESDRVTERAETTFAWTPDSRACEACGDQTQRRWRTDAGFVCPDCVDWERAPEH